MTPRVCSIPGCGRPHHGRGYCQRHYRQAQARGGLPNPGPTCTHPGCDRRHYARGWCQPHYQRWQRTGDPYGQQSPPPCKEPGCDRRHYARGWCELHYIRWRSHGDPRIRKTASHGHASGGRSSPEHFAWMAMKARCLNPQHTDWANYGGRGITVCPEWQADFLAFLAHIGPRPGPGWSLDRIDNDRGYEPGNVRWATVNQQAQNQRGRRPPLAWRVGSWPPAEWERRLGLPPGTVRTRLRAGWPVERTLTEPLAGHP